MQQPTNDLTGSSVWTRTRVLVVLILLAQLVSHLGWLSFSTHSGQVAIPLMLNQGRVLFDNVLEQHAPGGSILSLLLLRLLPVSFSVGIKLLNTGLVLSTSLLIYAAAHRLRGPSAGLAALLFWALWEPVYGNIMFYYDSILGFLLLLAVMVWWRFSAAPRGWVAPLFSGLILGLATLFKQHAWAGVGLFVLWLLMNWRSLTHPYRTVGIFIGATSFFPLMLLGIVAVQGNLASYLYWNWSFNLSGLMPGESFTGDFLRKVLLTNVLAPAFLLLAWRDKARSDGALVAVMWLAGWATLVPRAGEYHVMGQLPALAVMSGSVMATGLQGWQPGHTRRWVQALSPGGLVLLGIACALLVGWGLTGIAPYAPGPLGPGGIVAYDEFQGVAAELKALSQPGDTLFVLPETDSTPQLHALSELLPPGLWIKGWAWYLRAPGVMDELLTQWAADPPIWIVYFPELTGAGQPEIEQLIAFMEQHYQPVSQVDEVILHGPAVIYRYSE